MGRKIDLAGQKFGRLSVVEYSGLDKRNACLWLCKCDCGNEITLSSDKLRSGHTKSCGCYRKEVDENKKGKPWHYKHLLGNTRLYNSWCNMKSRCYNKKKQFYKDYGERGIYVCDEWKNDFLAFYNWAMANGYRDDLTLDRIDVNGIYEPSNCRWVDLYVQANNKRNNKMLNYRGTEYPIHILARMFGLDSSCLRWRIDNGWDIERALHTKSARKNHAVTN